MSSTTNIQNVNTSGQELFTASNVASTCTARESGISGSTTITNGRLQTSEGNPNVEGDEVFVNIPTNPAPNTTYNGQMENIGDSFQYIFNEQIRNPDGSITVYAAHARFLGPTAVGDLYIGKSECGVTAGPDLTAPKVISTAPRANATGIAPTANVRATFNEPMMRSSLNGATVKLIKKGTTRAVGAALSYPAPNKVVLNPKRNLVGGATYTAIIVGGASGAKDLAGNALAVSVRWSFKIRA